MKQKSVGMTLRAFIIALALILVAGSPALPPFDGVAYAQSTGTGLTATASVGPDGSNSVNLAWNAVDGADSYDIWRTVVVGTTVNWSSYTSVNAPTVTYTDNAVTAGTTYGYAVRAVTGGTAASWSGPYPRVNIPTNVVAPTGRPSVTVTADGTTAVDVTWTAVTTGTDVSYQVQFWHTGLDDWDDSIPAQTSRSYKHTGLTPGTEYYYVVRAFNAGGEIFSRWQDDDSKITLEATTAVPKLEFEHVSRNVVRLTWSATTNAATYDLQRKKVITGTGADAGSYARLPDDVLSAETRMYRDEAATFGTIAGSDATTKVTYYYRVQARDSGGIGGDWSNEVMVAIPATGTLLPAPAAPTTPSVGNTSIRVEWAAVDDATYYQIRWKAGDGSYSTPQRETSPFTHTGLTPSTKYTYQVRAVNINGAGDWSPEASATTRSGASATGLVKMPKVTGLRVMDETTDGTDGALNFKVKLTWNSVSGATHYDIQRFDPAATTPAWGSLAETAGESTTVEAKSGSTQTYEDMDATLTAAKTYYYVVSAVDDGIDDTAGNTDDDMGEWSEHDSLTLKDYKPTMPTGLTATATGTTSIWVSWTAPAVDRAGTPPTGAATSYTLQWRRDGQAYRDRDVMNVMGMTYHHSGLTANTTYWYRVLAKNSGGMSTHTAEIEAKTLPQRLMPPGNVMAVDASTDTAEGIKISWSAVTGATGYEIQRFGASWGALDGTAGGDSDVSETMITDSDTSLAANTTYHYRVRTVVGTGDSAAKSEWSAVASGTTKHGTTTGPTLVATTVGTSMIRLSWGAVADATAYELEWVEGPLALDDTGFGNVRITRMDMTLGGNLRNYLHSGLKSGTQYSYRMRAALPQGVYSAWSTVNVQPYTKPARPMLSVTTAVSTTMTLNWDAVSFTVETTGAAGHLADATNYQVERRVSGSTAWATVTATITCPSNKCTLEDTGLTASTLYWYRVRATVTRGGTTYMSYWDQDNQRTPR